MLTQEEKKKALAYIRHRFPVGTEVYGSHCAHPYLIHKRSVYEVMEEDETETVEYNKFLDFNVRDAGSNTVSYFFHSLAKNWVMDYYNTKLSA